MIADVVRRVAAAGVEETPVYDIGLVVGDKTSPTTDDVTFRDWLVNTLGHTVTYIDDNDSEVAAGTHDLIIISESVLSSEVASKYDEDYADPVLNFELGCRGPHNFTAGGSTTSVAGDTATTVTDDTYTNGVSHTSQALAQSSDTINYFSGHSAIGNVFLTRSSDSAPVGVAFESGDTMADGSTIAAARRIMLIFGNNAMGGLTTFGEDLVEGCINWLLTPPPSPSLSVEMLAPMVGYNTFLSTPWNLTFSSATPDSGDWIYAVVYTWNNDTTVAISGYSTVHDQGDGTSRIRVLRKLSDGTETSLSVTRPGSSGANGTICAFVVRGADQTEPEEDNEFSNIFTYPFATDTAVTPDLDAANLDTVEVGFTVWRGASGTVSSTWATQLDELDSDDSNNQVIATFSTMPGPTETGSAVAGRRSTTISTSSYYPMSFGCLFIPA